MSDSKVIAELYSNTCAIAWCDANFDWQSPSINWNEKPMPIHIKGTGFLISPRVVVTAAHTVREIMRHGIAFDEITVAFAVCSPEHPHGHLQIGFQKTLEVLWMSATRADGTEISPPGLKHPLNDFALLVMPHNLVIRDLPSPQGLKFADPNEVFLADPVIVPGYYLSSQMLAPSGQAQCRFGPIFMRGNLASVTPFGIRGYDGAPDYHIDVTSGGGQSGAPVCTVKGEVIGMLTGGVETELEEIPQQKIPRNLARALPMSERMMAPLRAAAHNLPPRGTETIAIPVSMPPPNPLT